MPKQILKSVGRSAANGSLADVMTVQYLLNCVPVHHGGPSIELVMDGLCGPKTIKAIDDFQVRQFGWADGRVDPKGQTMGALLGFDPAPNQPLPPPGGSDLKNAGQAPPGSKTGGPGYKSGGDGQKNGGVGGFIWKAPLYPDGHKSGPGGAGYKSGGPGAGHKSGGPGAGHKSGGFGTKGF